MKQQQKYPIKLHMTNKQFFYVEYIHLNAFTQILEGTSLATTLQRSYGIKHYKKHTEFEW